MPFLVGIAERNKEGEGQGKEKGRGRGKGRGEGAAERSRLQGVYERQGLREGGGQGGIGEGEEHSGTLGARMMCGPMLSFFSMRLARKLMVWMVLPRPISSARMPFMLLLLYRDIRNLRPPSW